MKFFDISLPLSDTTIAWPGDVKFNRHEHKGSATVSTLTMSTHTGTHIDAPKHFLFNKNGIDNILISKLIGSVQIVNVKSTQFITLKDVLSLGVKKGDKFLFKTKNSALYKKKKFISDYVSLSLDAAKFLAYKKIDLVGTDYFGIEAKSSPGHPVHKILLGAGIVIVEGLDLSKIKPGKYNIAALPLKVKDSDGSPARVILWK